MVKSSWFLLSGQFSQQYKRILIYLEPAISLCQHPHHSFFLRQHSQSCYRERLHSPDTNVYPKPGPNAHLLQHTRHFSDHSVSPIRDQFTDGSRLSQPEPPCIVSHLSFLGTAHTHTVTEGILTCHSVSCALGLARGVERPPEMHSCYLPLTHTTPAESTLCPKWGRAVLYRDQGTGLSGSMGSNLHSAV